MELVLMTHVGWSFTFIMRKKRPHLIRPNVTGFLWFWELAEKILLFLSAEEPLARNKKDVARVYVGWWWRRQADQRIQSDFPWLLECILTSAFEKRWAVIWEFTLRWILKLVGEIEPRRGVSTPVPWKQFFPLPPLPAVQEFGSRSFPGLI